MNVQKSPHFHRQKIRLSLASVWREKIGGVESATYNICKALSKQDVDLRLTVTRNERLSDEFNNWLAVNSHVIGVTKQVSLPARSLRFAEELIHTLYERNDEAIIYPNYFLPPRVIGSAFRAVIIHDCQHRVFPEFYSLQKRLWLDACYQWALKSADLVLTISEFEKQQLRRFYGSKHQSKVKVVGNAIDFERLTSGNKPNAGHYGSYLLSVCHHFPHKNVELLISAFEKLAQVRENLDLVLVGTSNDRISAHKDSLPASVRKRIHLTGFVSDSELGDLYRSAELFVLPSLYEGFGMPAVEAIGMGVPTLVSDAGALPEITLGLVPTVPAKSDADFWARQISRALAEPPAPEKLTQNANKIKETYSPLAVGDRIAAALHVDLLS